MIHLFRLLRVAFWNVSMWSEHSLCFCICVVFCSNRCGQPLSCWKL